MGRLVVPQPEPAMATSLMFSCSIAPGHIIGSGEEPAPAAVRRSRNDLKDVDGLASLLAPVTSAKLLEDVRALKRNGLASDAATLAQRLRELGYSCSARRQEGSHAGQGTMRLAHEFVVVEGPSLPEPLVVEPFFRDHFTIGRAFTTDRYATVLAAAPEELVATYRQLADLVKLLCQEMQFSFEANGNFLPPWRSTRTVLSRWSPARAA